MLFGTYYRIRVKGASWAGTSLNSDQIIELNKSNQGMGLLSRVMIFNICGFFYQCRRAYDISRCA